MHSPFSTTKLRILLNSLEEFTIPLHFGINTYEHIGHFIGKLGSISLGLGCNFQFFLGALDLLSGWHLLYLGKIFELVKEMNGISKIMVHNHTEGICDIVFPFIRNTSLNILFSD